MARDTFRGKVALITGGASGIGAALGKAMARSGAEVILADRQVELASDVAKSIVDRGGRADAVELDVRNLAGFERVVTGIVARSRRIDYLFNNAGIGVGGEIEAYSARDWDDVIDVNLRGVAYGIQAVYPVMIREGSGHIVNTASVAGLLSAAGEGSYAATKHAVVGLSKALRIEAKRHGVRVSVLCPGVIRTPILTGGKYGRMNYEGLADEKVLELWSALRPMDADAFAEKVLREVERNVAFIVVPGWWKALWYLERLSPTIGLAIWSRLHAKLRAEIEAAGAKPLSREERNTEKKRVSVEN